MTRSVARVLPAAAPLALLAGALAAGCGGEPPLPEGAVPNAVLVTLDTTRLNALSSFGCPVRSTPNLDRVALEGVRYRWCRAVAPITAPSHASMLTGLYPPRHGLRNNGFGALPQAAVTLAERAREAGVETAAFVAALVLDEDFGLDQGFHLYDQPPRPERQQTSAFEERPAHEVVDAAVRWIEARPDPAARFLVWIHLFDPHAPWDPDPRFSEQVAGPEGQSLPYIAEVAAMDHALERLFGALERGGRLADTAVLVVADHGEALHEHGEPNHAAFVYDGTLRVPLFLRYPDGYRAGETSDEITSVVDVAPTLAEALALPPLEGIDGVSLWRRHVPAERGVYFESFHGFLAYGWAPLAGFADAGGKYIHSPEPELYRPQVDPKENRNEVEQHPEEAERYRARIAEVVGAPALPLDESATSEDLLAELAALGYATAAVRAIELPSPLDPSDRPAPAARVDEYRRFLEAQQLMEERKLSEAVERLEVIVLENPNHVSALDKLALAFVIVEGWDPAIVLLEQRLEVAEGSAATYSNLALAYEQTGRLEQALEMLERAIELSPSGNTPRQNMARVLTKLGRVDEAAVLLDQGQTLDSTPSE